MRAETSEERLERQSLYESYRRSGQSLALHSREVGTTPWKIRQAVKKTELEGKSKAGFKELSVPLVGSVGLKSEEEIGIILRNGMELRVPSLISEVRLLDLLRILSTC